MKYFVLAIAFAAILSGCVQREGGPIRESAQPAAAASVAETTEVHGSMYATVKGQKWSASGSPSEKSLENVVAMIDPKTGELTIAGDRVTHHAVAKDAIDRIEITLKDAQPGDYELMPGFDHKQTAMYCKGADSTAQVFFIQGGQSGKVSLTRFDTAERRIFGTFQFECRSSNGKTMKIEDGAFDNVKCQ